MVYSRIPNNQKLDKKSERGILVSFGANQYKILDTTRNKTCQARDVIILEGRFKNLESNSDLNSNSNSNSKHLELEVANSNPQGSPPSQQPENDATPNLDSLPRQPDVASQDIASRR